MAFTVHYDQLCTAWRSALLVFNGVFQLPYFSELNLTTYMWFLKPLFVGFPDSIAMATQHNFSVTPDSANYATFLNSIYIFRFLFQLKFLYLIIDSVLLYAIWRYFKNDNNKLTILLFWAINPFFLYSTYMWGRYEVFPVLFLFLSFISASKAASSKSSLLSAVLLGLAISYRISFILFLPLLLIYYYKDIKRSLFLAATVLSPYLLTTLLTRLFGGGRAVSEYVDIMFTGQLGNGFTSISLFVVACILLFYFAARLKAEGKFNFRQYIYYSGLTIFSYFAFAQFYPQYFAWITPIALIFIAFDKRVFYPFLLLFIVFFFLADAYFGCFASMCMIASTLSPEFASTFQSFTIQLVEKLSNLTIFTLLHSLMIGIFGIIALLVKQKIDEDQQ